jgi:apolipoprotein N-acyltransferase
MIPVTIPGFLALSFYGSLFFPLAAWPIRHMHRRHGISVAVTTAIVWTAAEYLRSTGDLSFPWLLLGHTQYEYLTMIQISDLVGVYGVSFVVAMVNGWVTDLFIQPILVWRAENISRVPLGTLSLAIVMACTVFYGVAQRSGRSFEAGPRVAVIQHDFPMYVDERSRRTTPAMISRAYQALAEEAVSRKPDLVVLPETAMTGYLNDEFINATPGELDEIRQRRFPPPWTRADLVVIQSQSRLLRDAFQRLASTSNVPFILGSLAMEWKPTSIPPRAEAFNSSFLLAPGRDKPTARYDKNHLVIFGEYVPFRYSYHWLYQWLNKITPFGADGFDFSLGAGSGFAVFEFTAPSRGGRAYRAGTPICYEEVMPYIGREFARRRGDGPPKNIDILITLSNDGWFLHAPELEQHLAGAVFRAVENRIGLARAVNTGASCFVEPNGRIVDRVTLSPEKVALLAPVEASLQRLYTIVRGMSPATTSLPTPEISSAQKELRAGLAAMGNEFGCIDERLTRLASEASHSGAASRPKALETLVDQIDEDIRTVQRWRTRPDTAPGFRISQVQCDPRLTLYTRWGDWFSQGAVAVTGIMLLDWMLRRMWQKFAGARREGAQA